MDILINNVNDNIIDNYIIEKFSSGIILVMVTTVNKYVDSGNINIYPDGSYINFYIDESDDYVLYIPELNLDTVKLYIQTKASNKDQIYFYFIPKELVTNNDKTIEFIKNKRQNN